MTGIEELQDEEPVNLPVWVPHGTIVTLAEHIVVVIMSAARDPDGLRIRAPIQHREMPNIAREALRKACGATHIIESGEPDPSLDDGSVILRGVR